MLFGAMLAGQAFANAPVAAVHALAYPLGGHYGVPHGLSNALVLPHVLRFNAPDAAHLYAEIAGAAFPDLSLGTSVLVLPWYHPLRLAEEIAMLNSMTNGTLHLGIGRGTAKMEYDAYNIDIAAGD